ncbi:MAG: hypothetical protein RIT45_3330, partial [Pseudomonadota bacterium]
MRHRSNSLLALLSVAALALTSVAGCGSDEIVEGSNTDAANDTGGGNLDSGNLTDGSTGGDTVSDATSDATDSVAAGKADGDPCTEGKECQSGLCAWGAEGKICAASCTDDA